MERSIKGVRVVKLPREEDKHDAMFGNRKYDLLEGRIIKLEKQVARLSKLVDPVYWYDGGSEPE